VIKDRRCKEVMDAFQFKKTVSNAASVLRKHYLKMLFEFEHMYYFNAPLAEFPKREKALMCLVDKSSNKDMDIEEAKPGLVFNGIIDGKFESGYLVTVKMGSEEFKGVVFHMRDQAPPETPRRKKKRAKTSHDYEEKILEKKKRVNMETVAVTNVAKTLAATNAAETVDATVKTETIAEMDEAENVAATVETGTVAKIQAVETVVVTNAAVTGAATDTTETVAATDTTETVAGMEVVEIVAGTESVETVAATEAMEFVAGMEAVETVAGMEVVETLAGTEAEEIVAATEAMETVVATDASETVAGIDAAASTSE
ncbi:hypothetical protein CARUB_v100220671mg, partial [Capsella rubella]